MDQRNTHFLTDDAANLRNMEWFTAPNVSVFYHDDSDGFGAAFVFDMLRREANFLHSVHGYAVTYEAGHLERQVQKDEQLMAEIEKEGGDPSVPAIFFDMTPPYKTALRIASEGRAVLVIDHHEAAVDNFVGNLDKDVEELLERNMIVAAIEPDAPQSAAGMAWRLFASAAEAERDPYGLGLLAYYIEDRDLWHFNLPFSRPLSQLIKSTPRDHHSYADLAAFMRRDLSEAARRGRAIEQYIDQACEYVLESALDVELTPDVEEPYSVRGPFVNSKTFQSELGHKLLSENGECIAGCFVVSDVGIAFSIRTQPPIDAGKVARAFGGGGHARAAGFFIPRHRWAEEAGRISLLASLQGEDPNRYVTGGGHQAEEGDDE